MPSLATALDSLCATSWLHPHRHCGQIFHPPLLLAVVPSSLKDFPAVFAGGSSLHERVVSVHPAHNDLPVHARQLLLEQTDTRRPLHKRRFVLSRHFSVPASA